MLDLYKKYKEMILYIVFGGLTTLVNMAVYYAMFDRMSFGNVISTIWAWILSVLFAYITNKLFVFESKSFSAKVLAAEMASFFLCRLATGVIDLAIMYLFVDMDICGMAADIWKLPVIGMIIKFPMIMKLLSNVIVIILNYIASKLFIFKKDKVQQETD